MRSESDEIATSALAWLFRPLGTTDFLTSYWGRRPLMIKREEPAYYSGLPGLDEFDGLITATAGARSPDGRLVRKESDGRVSRYPFRMTTDGRPDIHHIFRHYEDGYTVVLDALELRSPAIATLCRRLESDLHQRVGANAYLTPRDTQGPRLHADWHDVIVTQLHGEKRWFVATEECRRPVAGVPLTLGDLADAREYVLRPGDALYIPRWHGHEAATDSASSFHLTFGIHSFTRADLLHEALRIAAEDDGSELQVSLAASYLSRPFERSEVDTILRRCFNELGDSSLELARVSLGSRLLRRQTATTGHFRSLDLIHHLTVDSIVTLGFDGPCRTMTIDDELVAHYDGNHVAVPGSLAPALEYALSRSAFTVGSIPCELSDPAKIELVGRLMCEGFLAMLPDERKGEDA